MDIKNHKILICGLQGSGKTYYAKQLITSKKVKTLIYTPHHYEFVSEPDNFILYKYKDYYADFEEFCKVAINLGKEKLIDGVMIDEFDNIFKNNYDVKRYFNEIILNHRHYNLFVIGITRRPQDIPTKYTESCKYLILFSIEGDNVKRKLNNLYKGLGDMVASLEYKSYKKVIKEIGKKPVIV